MHLALDTARVFNRSLTESKQGVILAAPHIFTRMKMGATLTHDHVTSDNLFATKSRPFRVEPRPFLCAILLHSLL